MKKNRMIPSAIVAFITLIILIIDAKTAVSGAKEGIEQCLKTMIPSLFPFFIVSSFFCQTFSMVNLSFLTPLCRLCKIPKGAEQILLMGMLGGYPVGAKEIAYAYKQNTIDKADAERMLGFCNNAGPAFIFGILASFFQSGIVTTAILLIQILSAIITGILLPGNPKEALPIRQKQSTLSAILNSSIRALTMVCGWMILFRIILAFLNKWLLRFLPISLSVMITGIFELANGCLQLNLIENTGLRFIITCGIISFGGICVMMQTRSVTGELSGRFYFPGKLIQTLVSIMLAFFSQLLLFPSSQHITLHYLIIPTSCITGILIILFYPKDKKSVAIPRKLMYNQEKHTKEESLCCFVKKSPVPAHIAPTVQN